MTKNNSPAMGAGFEPDDRVVYKTAGETQLWMDFFTPKSRESPAPLPAIVLFHGGGWEVSHTDQFHPQCHYFASRGIPAIAAEYRVSEKHGTSPFESVADAKSAIRWIRSNAAGLGVDPRRIVAGGGSSGGHVAAAAAMLAGFDEDGEDLSISVKPNALVLFNPVTTSPVAHRRRSYFRALMTRISRFQL